MVEVNQELLERLHKLIRSYRGPMSLPAVAGTYVKAFGTMKDLPALDIATDMEALMTTDSPDIAIAIGAKYGDQRGGRVMRQDSDANIHAAYVVSELAFTKHNILSGNTQHVEAMLRHIASVLI